MKTDSIRPVSFMGLYGTKAFGRFMEVCDEHNPAVQAGAGLVFASILRPITIMSLPGQKKNQEDKFYASTHAISSGLMSFLVSTAVTVPLNNRLKELRADPEKYGFKIFEKLKNQIDNSGDIAIKNAAQQAMDRLNTIMKNIPEWGIAIPRSMLTVAMIPVIQKYVFGVQKNKKSGKMEPLTFIDKPVFEQFHKRRVA